MEIPLIPENVLTTLSNQLESDFDLNVKGNANKHAKQGIYAMELALGIDEDGSYRSEIFNWWLGNKFLVSRLSVKEKIVQWGGFIFGPLLLISIPVFGVLVHVPPWWLIVFLFILAFVLILLPTNLFKKKYRSDGEKAAAQLDPWELFECSQEKATLSLDTNLGKICEKLDINPTEAKIGLGKVKGGGSTYVGWGSGRAIGAGIGLSALSSIRAASKNSATNSRIKELENYIYYNNVARYFIATIEP